MRFKEIQMVIISFHFTILRYVCMLLLAPLTSVVTI